MSDRTMLITGVTGSTGAAVLRHVLADQPPDAEVRAMVRQPEAADRLAPGVTPVLGNFDDEGSVASALAGVRRAYLVTPSSETAETQQLRFVELAAAAGVERIVLLSQLGTRPDSPVRFLRYHAAVENRIAELGLGHTFLRPNLFFQGLLAMAGYITATGKVSAPIGEARVSAVDVDDIGAVGAKALLEDRHDGAIYTITGPAAITHTEMAAELSRATGRQIEFADTDPDDFKQAMTGALPPWQVEGLLEDYAHYSRGEAAEVTDVVASVTGRAPRPFAAFADAYAKSFGG